MKTCENGGKIPNRSRYVLGRFYCILINQATVKIWGSSLRRGIKNFFLNKPAKLDFVQTAEGLLQCSRNRSYWSL